MFDVVDYLNKAKSIRDANLWTDGILAKHIGISHGTLIKLYKAGNETIATFVTLRKLRDFIEENYKEKK